jgi:Fe-S-cluster-containing hydrogenase component 2
MDVCSSKVIGRIDLLWHKHIRFTHETACTGCMKCMKVCTAGAITKLANA